MTGARSESNERPRSRSTSRPLMRAESATYDVCSGTGAEMTTSCALDSPALLTRTVICASLPGTARSPRASKAMPVSSPASCGRLRAMSRTTFEPTGGTSNEATAACSSTVVPFSIDPATQNEASMRRSSPGATSPMCAPSRVISGEFPRSSSISTPSKRPVPTRYIRPSGTANRTRTPVAGAPPWLRNVNAARTVIPGSNSCSGETTSVRKPSGSGGAPGVRISDMLGIVRHVSPPAKRHLERLRPKKRDRVPGVRPTRKGLSKMLAVNEDRIASAVSRLGSENAFEVLARARVLESEGRRIVHMEIGEPDFDTPEHIKQAAIDALHDSHTHYSPSAGIPELRDDHRRVRVEVSRNRAGLRPRKRRRRSGSQTDHLEPAFVASQSGRRVRVFRSGLSGLRFLRELSPSRRAARFRCSKSGTGAWIWTSSRDAWVRKRKRSSSIRLTIRPAAS